MLQYWKIGIVAMPIDLVKTLYGYSALPKDNFKLYNHNPYTNAMS